MMSRNSLVPIGAWDTHTHVFDPANFPYAIPRSYTPKAAQVTEYPVKTTGCTCVVIVHASIQGSSPKALLDTLSKAQSSGLTLRGLATIDIENTTDAELDALHAAGVRGARLHEMSWGHGTQAGGSQIGKKVAALAERFGRLGWAIGVFCDIRAWASMASQIRTMDPRVKMIADHLGGTFPSEEATPEFATFLDLVREGLVTVKVSGFERLYQGRGRGRGGMGSIEPIVKAIVAAGPDRIIYGSDWPHTQLGVARKWKSDQQRLDDVEGFRDVPDDVHIEVLREWITDDEVWKKLFVTNSEKIFL
ncbi:amidohydrolase 2 [Cadophora sp. DSE1049]|nr:amidohydrolase 2 [Cadophora sp. DSE1049]